MRIELKTIFCALLVAGIANLFSAVAMAQDGTDLPDHVMVSLVKEPTPNPAGINEEIKLQFGFILSYDLKKNAELMQKYTFGQQEVSLEFGGGDAEMIEIDTNAKTEGPNNQFVKNAAGKYTAANKWIIKSKDTSKTNEPLIPNASLKFRHDSRGSKGCRVKISVNVYDKKGNKVTRIPLLGEKSVDYEIVDLRIVSMPEILMAGAKAYVPITVQIFGHGDGKNGNFPKIAEIQVKFYLNGNDETFVYDAPYWGAGDGTGGKNNGESCIYTIWVDINKFSGGQYTNTGVKYEKSRFTVTCKIASHNSDVWTTYSTPNISTEGKLKAFYDEGLQVVEMNQPRVGENGLVINMNRKGESKVYHTGSDHIADWIYYGTYENSWDNIKYDKIQYTALSCGSYDIRYPGAFNTFPEQKFIWKIPLEHECGNQKNGNVCNLPLGAGHEGLSKLEQSTVEESNMIFLRAFAESKKNISGIPDLPSPPVLNYHKNNMKVRNYGYTLGMSFGCSYAVKEVEQLNEILPLNSIKGMNLSYNAYTTAKVNMFPQGYIEFFNEKSGLAGASPEVGIGKITSITLSAAAALTSNYLVASIPLSLSVIVVDLLTDMDKKVADPNWAHEVVLIRSWPDSSNPNPRPTDYDAGGVCELISATSSLTNPDKQNRAADLVRKDLELVVGRIYYPHIKIGAVLSAVNTIDDTWFQASCKYTNGNELKAKVDFIPYKK